jgi:hypothetical protein
MTRPVVCRGQQIREQGIHTPVLDALFDPNSPSVRKTEISTRLRYRCHFVLRLSRIFRQNCKLVGVIAVA